MSSLAVDTPAPPQASLTPLPTPPSIGLSVAAAVAATTAPAPSSQNAHPAERDYALRDLRVQAAFRAVRASSHLDAALLLDAGAMASQHHLSAYSRLKWGPYGAPWAYLPASLIDPSAAAQATQAQKAADAAAADRQLRRDKHPHARRGAVYPSLGQTDGADYEPTLFDARQAVKDTEVWAPLPCPPGPTMPDPATVAALQGLAVKTSATHPVSMSTIVPTDLLPAVSSSIFSRLPRPVKEELSHPAPRSLPGPCSLNTEAHMDLQRRGKRLVRLPPSLDLANLAGSGGLATGSLPEAVGPQGRGTICRDIDHDVARIAQAGVGALVCCLDDTELSFLGVPWASYEAAAEAHGLDLIRLPLAEGYAPLDIAAFDRALTQIVLDYTLRGVPVLAHCRGGVGRAGLFAAAWMLKMGLVPPHPPTPPLESGSFHAAAKLLSLGGPGAAHDRQDRPIAGHMATAHEAIQAIRKRRSPKAIETAEQVRFLAAYCAYLDAQAAHAASETPLDFPPQSQSQS